MIEGILKKFKKFGEFYGEYGIHNLTIGGGEPLVRDDLEDIVFMAVHMGFLTRVATNGTLIDGKRAKSLKKSGLTFIQVSLDGSCEHTYEKIRGKGIWNQVISGIKNLKKAGFWILLHMVLLPGINIDEAPLLLNLAQELGVAGVKFSRPVYEGNACYNISYNAGFIETFVNILKHGRKRHYRRLLFFCDPLAHVLPVYVPNMLKGLWGLATDMCNCRKTEIVEVNGVTGDIYYCRVREKLGNIFSDDLVHLWETHHLLKAIRYRNPSEKCICCPVWNVCNGGCPACGKKGSFPEDDADCTETILNSLEDIYKEPAVMENLKLFFRKYFYSHFV